MCGLDHGWGFGKERVRMGGRAGLRYWRNRLTGLVRIGGRSGIYGGVRSRICREGVWDYGLWLCGLVLNHL